MSQPSHPPHVVQVASPDTQDNPVLPQGHDTTRTGSGAWNAPVSVAYTEDSSQRFGFGDKKAIPRYRRLATEALKTALGPMPVAAFLDAFLSNEPNVDDDMPPSKGAFEQLAQTIENMKSSDRKKPKESHLYAPLARALNNRDSCPGFIFRVTADHPDESHGKVGSTKPDVICYAKEHMTHNELTSADVRARTDMGFAETFIEVKKTDPFCDPPSNTSSDAWPFFLGTRNVSLDSGTHAEALEDLGQCIAYAVEILARQHRYFLFSVALAMTHARLIRWDRSGFIVSESFDVIEQPHYLCMFFWRLSKLPESARGYDSTVELASEAEENIFKMSIQAHLIKQLNLDAASDAMREYLNIHYKPGHVTAILMPSAARDNGNPTSTTQRKLLISRPICMPLSPSGRCTRTYWAVNLETADSSAAPRDVWLLKDTWRIVSPSGAQDSTVSNGGSVDEREGSIMQGLSSKGVPNVPPVVAHWDVAATSSDIQSTITQRYLEGKWVSRGGDSAYCLRTTRVVHRVHYRLVLKSAGFDLLQISSTEELLYATYDVFRALSTAYREARRLHRDVHPGNIILFRVEAADTTRSPPRTGYLIDWESSCGVNTKPSEGSAITDRYEPSLQWQFLSWKLASRSKSTYAVMDDVESLIYVVIYCGILRLRCELAKDRKALVDAIQGLFDARTTVTNTTKGGVGKLSDILYLHHSNGIQWTSTALQEWVSGAYALRRSAFNLSNPSQPPHPWDNHWHLDSMARFWTSFFAENAELPRDDRALNVLSREVYFSYVAPRLALGTVFEPTTASKRTRTGSLAVSDKRSAKRRRAEATEDAAGPSSTGATYELAAASMADELGHIAKKQKGDGQGSAKPRARMPRGGERSKRGR
ncbi:hypothetical protein PYCCODRAFT_1435404 [Trametes coccinea BRFM310]|uniref:Fungal-type protein kinase domain-containing protein n=1 Tax=Trametes coccinea (strain BRFM310) TaxID=1353009 RepID=A0A1Y2IP66_TRAC3|nr:hypothetical protein PYCCODRAFT_1435404 [Trametes coccinea BRFM310]